MKNPNFSETLAELDAGLIESLLSQVTAEVALGVIAHGKPGKVVLTLDIKQIEQSSQVSIANTVSFIQPTRCGKQTEVFTTSTPMHVSKNGYISIAPENQLDIFKPKTETA